MKTSENIANINIEIGKLRRQVKWLKAHATALDKIGLPVAMYAHCLDFNNLTHKQVISVVRELGGKWSKEPTDDGRVNYTTRIDGLDVRCWRGEPPPSCKLVPFEEHVPATTRIAYKLVCQKGALTA